jgi:hypothetical protein
VVGVMDSYWLWKLNFRLGHSCEWEQKIVAINSSGRTDWVNISLSSSAEHSHSLPLDSSSCYCVSLGVLVTKIGLYTTVVQQPLRHRVPQQKWVPGIIPGGKGGQCVSLTTLLPSCADLSWNLGASTSWNPQGLSNPVMGLLYLYRFTPVP